MVSGQLNTLSVGTAGPRVAFLHGLFGQGRNWSTIAKGLAGPSGEDARCTLIDLPDHGRSPWTAGFSFEAYAASVASTLRAIDSGPWVMVGHSLGGKVAMVLALTEPTLIDKLVVVDIAPKSYGNLDRFTGYMSEMKRLPLGELRDRADAEARFEEPDPGVKAFLLQNLRREGSSWRWQANLELLAADAALGTGSVIADFPFEPGDVEPFAGPVLWLTGAESRYVKDGDGERMRGFFPRTRQLTVKGAGHWVHSEAPAVVTEALRRVLTAAASA